MKHASRKLLSIIPLLPLLMANSAVPGIYEQEYKDFRVTYVKEESLYDYYFYTFIINNTGNGYIQSINLYSDEKSFNASIYDEDIYSPFNNGLLEPGFNGERVFVTRYKIPESKNVKASAYAYSIIAEEITLKGTNEVTYAIDESVINDHYAYHVDCAFENMDNDYFYAAAIKITYDGKTYCVRSNDYNHLEFSTREQLDLSKLAISEIVPLKSKKYGYGFVDFGEALLPLLIFLLVFGLLLSFGIFAAIFFPAMARRKRRNRMNAANK